MDMYALCAYDRVDCEHSIGISPADMSCADIFGRLLNRNSPVFNEVSGWFELLIGIST